MEGLTLATRAQAALAEKKGEDIRLLDVRKLSSVTDYYLIVTGHSAPQLKALHQEVELALKKEGTRVFRKSGTPESGWMVLDFVDVVVHIFTAEARAYYALEELWNDAAVVAPVST